MKSIAFDVKGTLDGVKGEALLTMLKYFQCSGWKVVVWSSVYSYATDFIEKNSLIGVEADQKITKSDVAERGSEEYDIVIDDCYMTAEWIAGKRVVMVQDIPTDMPVNFAKQLIDETR